jgi:hypothetical protein
MNSSQYTEAMGKRGAARLRKEKRFSKALESAFIADALGQGKAPAASQDARRGPLPRRRAPRAPKKARKVPKAKLHKRLRNALDKDFSLLVRAMDPVCFWPPCGKPSANCFHFFTRSKWSIRWDLRNATGSCAGHNILYEQDQAFIDDVRIWFVGKFGQDVWDTLKRDGNRLANFSNDELAAILDGIRQRMKTFSASDELRG